MSMALRNILLLSGGLVMLAVTSPLLTGYTIGPVSYTHLTLPTSDLV